MSKCSKLFGAHKAKKDLEKQGYDETHRSLRNAICTSRSKCTARPSSTTPNQLKRTYTTQRVVFGVQFSAHITTWLGPSTYAVHPGAKRRRFIVPFICNMTDNDAAASENRGRKLLAADGWPEWMSAGDRRLLQSSTVTPNVVVAADRSRDYRMVEAVAAAPEKSSSRYVIRIEAGVYRENVEVLKKTNIMFVGDGSGFEVNNNQAQGIR